MTGLDSTRVGLIWAEAHGGVIGAAGGMPWHVPEDLAHFTDVTRGAPVVMGRRTWESLPDRFRPLPGRRNIVVTSDDTWQAAGAERASSLDHAVTLSSAQTPVPPVPPVPTRAQGNDVGTVWVIGGGRLYREAIARADVLEVTELDLDVAGDTYAPDRGDWRTVVAGDWQLSRTGIRYRFLTLTR